MVAAWFSVLMAAGAFAVELTLSGGASRTSRRFLGWMVLVHSAIGLGEAIITGAVVLRYVLQTLVRPDLIYQPDVWEPGFTHSVRNGRWGLVAAGGLGWWRWRVAIIPGPVRVSGSPDGLEKRRDGAGWVSWSRPTRSSGRCCRLQIRRYRA